MSAFDREHRNADLARIHMAVSSLGWSDDDYRAILLQKTGKTSSSELDARGRKTFIEHLQKCGWTPVRKKPATQVDKIIWLWRSLNEAGGLCDASKAALMAFVSRTASAEVADLQFLPAAEASKVIEALKSMLARAERASSKR